MTTKDWIKLNLPELNEGQITQLNNYIAEREREAKIGELQWADSQLIAIPCEEDCTPERHAHHQGSWDMCRELEIEIDARLRTLTQQTIKEREE